ncbi:hypothetical protein Taro_031539 [Colocasia esculenta]|uniref:Uncharacterized protein n=1 Tax=Colocasia esculenta TaxID=4460 RepID=A0A843VUX7_COLES|nr:hypothetical protein [Colocasia esculenta]
MHLSTDVDRLTKGRRLGFPGDLSLCGSIGRRLESVDRYTFARSLLVLSVLICRQASVGLSTSETGVPVLEEDIAMKSRGRRGAQAREDEHRREERREQQAPVPQCPTVLPPPPPVDYGVFMQGLVQATQTQAQTQAALQAMFQAQAQAPALIPQEHGHGGPSIMERFKRMAPPSFKGESQPLLAESWMREVDNIFWAMRREPLFGGPPYYVPDGYTTISQLQAQRQEGVSSLWKGTRRHRGLEARREVSQVWQHRSPDLRLPQTSAER